MTPPHAEQGLVTECIATLRTKTALVPRIGIVLGSGLGGVADRIDLTRGGASFDTAALPHWPPSTVMGHAGKFVLGHWEGTPVAVLRGRTHVYEGYDLGRVTFAHRVMIALGVDTLLVTNAVGTFNRNFAPGDLMLVRDHINGIGRRGLFTPEELAVAPGGTRGAIGRRRPYTPELIALLREVALERGIRLREGVLFAGTGPAYETAAEIAMARALGADCACMSSAHEVDLAAALGLATAAVSCITNYGTGISTTALSHHEVEEVAGQAAGRLEALLAGAVARL
ncbi:MAG: purine-nucleoside phosphorylase [Candidatus Eisenbacteria bacterium]